MKAGASSNPALPTSLVSSSKRGKQTSFEEKKGAKVLRVH